MSLIDQQLMFSIDQAITADAISTNVIDLNPNGGPNLLHNLGAGVPLYLYILVTAALTDADGTPTLTVTLESDDNTSLSSATTHWTVSAIAEATLVAGYYIAEGIALPSGNYQRYLGLRYTTNTADFDGGTVKAWLSPYRHDTTVYDSAVTTGIN